MTTAQRWRSSAAGGVLGMVALFLVCAILGGALSAYRAFQTIETLSVQLTDARDQIDDLGRDNARLSEQNRKILAQNQALVKYLRRHGLSIPRVAVPEGAGIPEAESPDSRPKAPRASGNPTGPGSPTPSGTPNPSPSPMTLCALVPILCQ